MTGAPNQATMSCSASRIRRDSIGFPRKRLRRARALSACTESSDEPALSGIAVRAASEPGTSTSRRRMLTARLPLSMKLCSSASNSSPLGADGPVVLPGGVLGDLQPCRILLEGQRLHLDARLRERLDCRLLGFALARLEIDIGDRRGVLERLPLVLAQAVPDSLRDEDRREHGERAVAAATVTNFAISWKRKLTSASNEFCATSSLPALHRRCAPRSTAWPQCVAPAAASMLLIVVAAAAARGQPLDARRVP